MINKKILIAAVLALSISVSAGCANVNKPESNDNENITEQDRNQYNLEYDETKQENIMKEYEDIINKENNISDYIDFMNKNIEYLSLNNASKLIVKLEEMQKEHQIKLEEKYYNPDIQVKLDETFKPEYDLKNININNIKGEDVKKILEETINLGYKLETAEGTFFPIIDYGFYEKYSSYTTQDIKDYMIIMTAESNKVPAKDAALVISWDELFRRAFNQEKFLTEHKDSLKYEEVKKLYNKYIVFAVYGLNNTPLFNYQDNKMNDDAIEAYKKAIAKDSKLSQVLKEYYEIIEKDGFKLTKNIKNYRDDLVKNMGYLP